MRFNHLPYSFLVLILLVFSCVEVSDCSVRDLNTNVQGKNVSVNISVESTGELSQFNWYFSDGFSKATSVPYVEHAFTQNGEYIVEVEVEQSTGDLCFYDAGIIIDDETIIEDTCDIDISTLAIDGSYITAKVSLEGDMNGAEFYWETGDGLHVTSTSNEFFYEYTQEGTYNFKVGYSRGACRDSAKKVIRIDEIDFETPCEITLDSLPTVIAKTVKFNLSPIQEPGVNYYWTMGDGTNAISTTYSDFQYTFNYPGTYDVYVMVEFGECFAEKHFEIEIPQGSVYNDVI